MLSSTRQWFRRHRNPIAAGVGIVGAGYLATQYVVRRLNDARERMSSDRIAKENLRRRFEQNQEDCTFTVLALLPTATTHILEAMNTEQITLEIQSMKSGSRSARSGESGVAPSIADTTMTEEEGKSTISVQSESVVHTSQLTLPPGSSAGDSGQESAQAPPPPRSRKTKRRLWDDLTISAITRAFTLLYTLALLTMLTRIQLNLLGRRSYLSSVISLATGAAQTTISLENNDDDNPDQAYGSDFETNRKYLTFSWWLLNRGWAHVMEKVEGAVREVFGHLSPRDLLSLDVFSQLTFELRKKIEGTTESERPGAQWLPFLLPPPGTEDFVLRESGVIGDSALAMHGSNTTAITPALRRLLDETSDLIESPAFCHVLTLLLDSGFSVLLNKKLMTGAFALDPRAASASSEPPEPDNVDLTKRAVLLPKILSVLTRQAHSIGNGMPNEYLQEMEQARDLEAFAAVVYSSNWENEIPQDEELVAATRDARDAVSTSGHVDDHAHYHQNRTSPMMLKPPMPEESLVVVDPHSSFESAWEKAVGSSQ